LLNFQACSSGSDFRLGARLGFQAQIQACIPGLDFLTRLRFRVWASSLDSSQALVTLDLDSGIRRVTGFHVYHN
jgi:hypothetical protein